jgi:hypothetical protein
MLDRLAGLCDSAGHGLALVARGFAARMAGAVRCGAHADLIGSGRKSHRRDHAQQHLLLAGAV